MSSLNNSLPQKNSPVSIFPKEIWDRIGEKCPECGSLKCLKTDEFELDGSMCTMTVRPYEIVCYCSVPPQKEWFGVEAELKRLEHIRQLKKERQERRKNGPQER